MKYNLPLSTVMIGVTKGSPKCHSIFLESNHFMGYKDVYQFIGQKGCGR